MTYLRAELRKLLTLPSLSLTVLITVASTGLLRWAVGEPGPAPLMYTQAGFLVLGVLAAASEHEAGGQIRTTLLAMPHRLPLLAAKAVTLAGTVLPVAAVTAVICGLGAAEAGFLVLTTLLSAAVAVVIRHTVPAALSLLGLFYIAGPLLREDLGGWLPDTAVTDPERGAVAAVVWAAVAAAAAGLTFHRRDA